MRKLIALTLVLTLALGMAGSVRAETEYYSSLLEGLTITCSEFMESSASRSLACAVAIVCYAMVHPDGADALSGLSTSGYAKIANWGNFLDIYLPRSSGGYLNLYIGPGNGKLNDYGYTSTVSSMKTYYDVSMSSVTDTLVDLLEYID